MSTAYTPATGDLLGGCRLERLAARGGMGVVFEATQLALDRRVAVKVISPHVAGDDVFRERFIREARLAASVHDPHIVDVYDAGEQDGVLYLVMRLVDGTDLRSVLRAARRLDPARALRLAGDVAHALDAAHRAGLIHRDVTPSNVLLEGDGPTERASLTDFGLVKSIDTTGVTGTGPWLGTAAYVAPEALRGEPIDGRADVYALACVLHRMLTGEAPYERGSDAATITAHLHDAPPRPSDHGLPAALDAVIARGLAKHPGDRPATAGELVAAARAALASESAGAAEGGEGATGRGGEALASGRGAAAARGERAWLAPRGGSEGRSAPEEARTSVLAGEDATRHLAATAGAAPVDGTRVMGTGEPDPGTRVMPPAGPERPGAGPHDAQAAGAGGAQAASTPGAAGAPPPAGRLRRGLRTAAGATLVALLAAGGGFALGAALSAEDPPPPRRPAVPQTPAAISLTPYATAAYSAGVPQTWKLVADDEQRGALRVSRWRAPEPWRAQIEILYSPGSQRDPDSLAEQVRAQTATLPTYTEIAFGPIALNGEDVVRWVYGTRGAVHMKWYGNPCETSIAVHGTTRPSEVLRWAPTMRAVAASVRPAC